MASRKIEVQIVGDAASLQRSFSKASKSARGFERDLGKSARGAVAASVSFHGLGRSIAFASSAFLGGAGLVYGIKSTIAAAEKSQSVLAQTENAVKKSGNSWAQYGQTIRKAALAQANLSGFDDERLLTTFSLLVRRTGDVNRALKLNALAADVARGRNISLEQAALLVTKASLGQAGALRRVGIAAKKGSTGLELVNMLSEKYAGSAAAYGQTAAGAQDRFRVAVENLQEAIGSGLLPEITKLLNPISAWLNDSANQARVQRDVNEAAKTAAGIFRDVAGATRTATGAIGGIKSAIELLLALKLGMIIGGWAKKLRELAAAERAVAAANAAAAIENLGAEAAAAAGGVSKLRLALLALGGPEVIAAVAAAAAGFAVYEGFKSAGKHLTSFKVKGGLLTKDTKTGQFSFRPSTANRGSTRPHPVTKAAAQQMLNDAGLTDSTGAVSPDVAAKVRAARARAGTSGSASDTAAAAHGKRSLSLQGKLNLAELAVAQASSTTAKADDIAALRGKAAILKAMIAKGGTLAQQTQRYQDLGSTLDQIASLSKKERAKRKKKAAVQQFAEPFKLQLAEAKAGATKTDSDDLKVWKTMRSWTARMIKANKFRGQALIDAWNEIARLNDNIANAAHTSAKQIATTSTKLLTANLGLSRAQRVELEQRIAQAQAHKFHVPNGQVGALGQVVNIGPVHVHGVQDPKKLIDGLAKHAKRKTSSTRGTHAGANLGLH